MKILTVATRESRLAIAQTEIVISALKKTYPDIQIEIKKTITKGDREENTALWELKGTGFFTSQIQDLLLTGEADFAVHSFKDLPTQQPKELTIAAVCDRSFPEDCLISAIGAKSIGELPTGAKIGTSSLRRIAQVKHLRADLQAAPIRGNVETRIAKLQSGQFDTIILARAGVERLGLAEKIAFCFDPVEFIPAPAQGALAIQTKTADLQTSRLIAAIDDKAARTVTFAERKVLATMHGGCHAPVGVFAKIFGPDIIINAFVSDLQGRNFISQRIAGPSERAEELAEKIAGQLLDAGGNKILEDLRK